ncbi:hypothetical protein U1Q18_007214, partial [Sarracenia purpurea var. burkii]
KESEAKFSNESYVKMNADHDKWNNQKPATQGGDEHRKAEDIGGRIERTGTGERDWTGRRA